MLLLGLGGALVAALAVTASIVRRVVAPVEALTSGARALAAGRLDVRVEAHGADELATLARSFNAMAETLERNEAARRDMASDVAHELRTPLASVRARIEAAQDGLVTADAACLASLAEDVGSLARLVDDLQQLSLAQAGRLHLDLADVSLAAVVGRVVEAAQPEADRRGLRLRMDVPGSLAARADPERLVQVLRNLVANAVAHARGEVEVSAVAQPGQVEVRVGMRVPPGSPPDATPVVAWGGGAPGVNAVVQLEGQWGLIVLSNYDPPAAQEVARNLSTRLGLGQ